MRYIGQYVYGLNTVHVEEANHSIEYKQVKRPNTTLQAYNTYIAAQCGLINLGRHVPEIELLAALMSGINTGIKVGMVTTCTVGLGMAVDVRCVIVLIASIIRVESDG